ncbi:MAG TPA: serine/threonine-protein kinase, partial [Thermoanaerobaculia bacterium]|nr:serine/threonine-protein kinase [Thermoanaerobaculia bacterium]
MSLPIGELVDGKYRVLERLGAGGMGEVYKVQHTYLNAIRVIKIIRPQISESADAHNRFLREAQLATKVQHPNVATLHDFAALPDGSHYMVWEYIDGENLAQVVRRRGTIPPQESIRLMLQALSGLDAIHRAGIIHRDLSPENLMITRDGNVKIIDLGVAKAEYGDYAQTQTGMFVGKLRYSSPEQLGFLQPGEKLDARADLYSLGVVLFEMLTGRPPFEATSPHQYFLQASGATNVQPIDLSIVPDAMRPVLSKALARDRNKRFANTTEFANALQNVTFPEAAATVRTQIIPQPPTSRSSQNAIIIIAIALLLAIGVAATWWYRSRPPVAMEKPAIVTSNIAAQKTATSVVEVSPSPAASQRPLPAGEVETAPQPQPVAEKPKPQPKPQPEPQPEPEPRPQPEPETQIATYFDGGGANNDAALASAQERVRGVRRVALDTTDPQLPA